MLFLIYLVFPLLEIYLLLEAGEEFGFWPIFGLVVLTAWAGSRLVKIQGFSVMNDLQMKVARGESPHKELGDGVMILLGGVLLIAPGFVTDGIGILLLLPITRHLLRGFILKGLEKRMKSGRVQVFSNWKGGGFPPPQGPSGPFGSEPSGVPFREIKDVTPPKKDD